MCVCVEGRNPGRGSRVRGSRGKSRDKFDDDDDDEEEDELSWIPPRPASDRYLPPPAGGLPPPADSLPDELWSETGRER